MPKQHMAALMTPVSVLLPVYVSRWTGGSRPLDCVTSTWMWRAIAALGASAVVLCVPEGVSEGPVPWGYYACLYLWLSLYAGLNTVHFVSFMAFYSRVSDETMGGTYMTLLNTVSNLGFKWCETAAMFAVDLASPKRCEGGRLPSGTSCAAAAAKDECVAGGGRCVNGDWPFHLLVGLSPVIAYVWLAFAAKHVDRLQKGGLAKWKVRKSPGR